MHTHIYARIDADMSTCVQVDTHFPNPNHSEIMGRGASKLYRHSTPINMNKT